MKVTVRAFSGMRPQMSQELLRPGEATYALNSVLQGGDLDPLNGTAFVTNLSATAGTVKSIYRFGQGTASDTDFWFQSNNEVSFVKGQIDGDTEERTYYTGHLAYPTKTKAGSLATAAAPYPSTSVPMGLYKPSAAPTVVVSGTATDPGSTAEDVAFVCTLVTDWGEEGPPSDPSIVYSWRAGQSLDVTLPTSGVPSYPGNTTKSGQVYVGKRLYRSATGTSGSARWLLVNTEGDIPLATASYSTTKVTANLGEALKTKGWLEPPDAMKGLTAMANGMMAGYVDNTVCFCEPFYPYAWPVRYQQSVDAPINGIAAFDQSLLVSTSRGLHLFTGPDPASVTGVRLPDPQSCVAPRAMVPMLGGVVFPTPDGIGFVSSSGFRMISEGLFTKREWAPYVTNPASMHAYEIDGRYVMFFDNGVQQGLVLKFGDEPTFSLTSVYATAGFRDAGRKSLFLCVENGATTREIRKWDAGTALQASWVSGVFRLPSPTNPGAARVSATGPVQFQIMADGIAVGAPITVNDSMPFRLPSGYRTMRMQFSLTSSAIVRSVEIADTVRALLNE